MLWIKRNLFLFVAGVISLVFLGAGALFLMGSAKTNTTVDAQLESRIQTLEQMYAARVFPSPENIALVQSNLARLRETIGQAEQYFVPVPFENTTGLAFKTRLDNAIAEMRQKATRASVKLPDDYAFSFKTEQQALTLPETSFPSLPAQLAEVELVAGILFDAKINALESIRRPRISASDTSSEYHNVPSRTNEATGFVESPYELTFFGFSQELGQILESFAGSKHGLIAKDLAITAVEVQSQATPSGGPGRPGMPQRPAVPSASRPGQPGAANPNVARRPVGAAPVLAASGLETVINEKLLKIVLWVYVVKPPAPQPAA